MTISLDCLGKFITYNYVGDMEDEAAQTQVMEKVVDGICDCFIGEETDKKVQLQIIKVQRKKTQFNQMLLQYLHIFKKIGSFGCSLFYQQSTAFISFIKSS
jgi:hypothetical protein